MIQNSINPNYEKRIAEKFRDAKKYLKANGFSKSTKHLLEDIENTTENKKSFERKTLIYNTKI